MALRYMRSSCFIPGIHWAGGCVSPRAGLDATDKKTIPVAVEKQTLFIQLLVSFFSDWAKPVQLSRTSFLIWVLIKNKMKEWDG